MQDLHKIDTIAIVGGGTAGYLTAALFSHKFQDYHITIIDKETPETVGVGEGTLLAFGAFLAKCGFSPEEWFNEIDATTKAGILFPGWGQNGEDVWHPFMFPVFKGNDGTEEVNLTDLWSQNQHYDFKEYGTVLYDLSVKKNKVNATALHGYAHHVDAGKLVSFIKAKLKERVFNVSFINSEVVDVVKNGEDIEYLSLNNGEKFSADLYIDCTGFKHLLSDSPEKVDVTGRLFCDTAVAAHVPYEDIRKEMIPYVKSEAVDHGWIWNIPVQTRIGSGLVFNRSITKIEEAKEYFCNYWDNRITPDQCKVLDWTPNYHKNIWHGNVVQIGLSAGFIEPLESTGVALIISGAEQLAFMLEPRYYTKSKQDYYNNLMQEYFEDAINFVSMHYSKPNKDTPFWNYVKDNFVKSPMIQFYEDQMKRSDVLLPKHGSGHFFGGSNWLLWMIQMGYECGEANTGLSNEQAEELMLSFYRDDSTPALENCPDHYDFIEHMKAQAKNASINI